MTLKVNYNTIPESVLWTKRCHVTLWMLCACLKLCWCLESLARHNISFFFKSSIFWSVFFSPFRYYKSIFVLTCLTSYLRLVPLSASSSFPCPFVHHSLVKLVMGWLISTVVYKQTHLSHDFWLTADLSVRKSTHCVRRSICWDQLAFRTTVAQSHVIGVFIFFCTQHKKSATLFCNNLWHIEISPFLTVIYWYCFQF